MSNLRMKTRSGQVCSQVFKEQFIGIAETQHDAAISMLHIPALLLNPLASEESHQENEDFQSMAVFMLLSGCVLGVKWGEFFYFGDVDRMDNEHGFDENMDDVTLLQYEIEDSKLDVDDMTTEQFRDVLQCFGEIDRECMRDGADAIPFSDTEYYAEQIMNIYDLEEADALKLADRMRKFVIFQESGKDVPDIKQYTDAYGEPHETVTWPGRVYLADAIEKCGLTIESTVDWDEEHKTHAWHLIIANQEWMSDDLELLELELFDFAVSAGWTDDL